MIRLKLPLTVEEDLTLSFWILLVNLLILLGGAGNGEEETKTLSTNSTRTEERSQAGPSSLDFRLFQHWLLGFQLRLHVCNSIGCRPKCVQALLQAVLQRSYCILGTPKRSKKAVQFYTAPQAAKLLAELHVFPKNGLPRFGLGFWFPNITSMRNLWRHVLWRWPSTDLSSRLVSEPEPAN